MSTSIKAKIAIPSNMPEPLWYSIGENPVEKCCPGRFVKVPLKSKVMVGILLELKLVNLPYETKEIREILPISAPNGTKWLQLLDWIAQYYCCPLPKVIEGALPSFLFKTPMSIDSPQKEPKSKEINHPWPPGLTNETICQLQTVQDSITTNTGYKSFLMKSNIERACIEIYARLIHTCLTLGKSVLILTPEITSAANISIKLKDCFNEKIHLLHSELKPKEKRETWESIIRNEARILIGVRTAVLCPISNPGLIIVHAEHESGYKQNEKQPFFHTRDTAIYLARLTQCVILMTSPTPSLESYFAGQGKKHTLIDLDQNVHDVEKPLHFKIINMKEQISMQGNQPLSIPLRDALTQTLEQGYKAIIMLNRKGFSRKRICSTCGKIAECPHCQLPMTYFKSRECMICPQCGNIGKESVCTHCSNTLFINLGMGLDQLYEHIGQLYPEERIIRFDSDTITTPLKAKKGLEEFEKSKNNILLGTQMVLKAVRISGVRLLGIIDADSGLGAMDFRAQEKVFQLLANCSLTLKEFAPEASLLTQTYLPESSVIKQAIGNKYNSFYEKELETRKELNYPPWTKLFRISLTGKKEASILYDKARFLNILEKQAYSLKITLLSSDLYAIKRIKDHYRIDFFGKGNNAGSIHTIIRKTMAEYHQVKRPDLKVQVDIDPFIFS